MLKEPKIDKVHLAVDVGISYHWGRHTFDFATYNAFDDMVIYHPNSELDPQNFKLTWRTRW